MSLSQEQALRIQNIYSERRRQNQKTERLRRDQVCLAVPAIRQIEESIAHISLEMARYKLFHPQEDPREELRRQIQDLSSQRALVLVSHDYPADYLDPVFVCPICKDTGQTEKGRCSCYVQLAAKILYEASNLASLPGRISFSSFSEDCYSDQPLDQRQSLSPRDNIRRILDQVRSFICQFEDIPGQNLLIYGNAGTGKTFLSACIAQELLDRGIGVLYLTAYQFFKRLEDHTFRRSDSDQDCIRQILDCDCLIIDDLGTELNNSFVNSQLFLCMNERILRKKSTIINTNLSLKQISRNYSERISSRIVESYTLLHLYGEDIRIKKAVSSLDES